GHKVSIGYFAQNQDELLNDEMTVLETVERIATGDVRTRLRDILGAFLFHGEDVDKKVKVLSGGERSRLATIQLLLEPYNLLLLDEPTNHLDIRSKEILKKALKKFDGTLIVVSHDRDFLDGLVDKVYEFRDKKIKTHLGGIAEFLRSRKIESLRELEKKESTAVKSSAESAGSASQPAPRSVTGRPSPGGVASSGSASSGSTSSGSTSIGSTSSASDLSAMAGAASVTGAPQKITPPLNSKERYLEKKETERVYRRLRRQAEESEAEITVLEKEIAEMNAKLASGDSAVVSDPAFYTSYEEKKKALDLLMQRWETAHNELEVFMADYMNGDANL
ncbi:MAG: ATP-binding cassette domain-containing protein, partial [Bacteroidales bacterium]